MKTRECLRAAADAIPFRYAQWVSEDADSRDYKVLEAINPERVTGYEFAHRTGVIGQVFRGARPIVITDVSKSDLYDPFDTAIAWEICLPIVRDAKVISVVNFEGSGVLSDPHKTVEHIGRIVRATTGAVLRIEDLQLDNPYFCKTHCIKVSGWQDEIAGTSALETARAISRAGRSSLLVGSYPQLLRSRGASMSDLSEDDAVGSSFFGIDEALDLLATGSLTSAQLLARTDWWEVARGRYEFVVVALDSLSDAPASGH